MRFCRSPMGESTVSSTLQPAQPLIASAVASLLAMAIA